MTSGSGQTESTQIREFAYFQFDHFLKSKNCQAVTKGLGKAQVHSGTGKGRLGGKSRHLLQNLAGSWRPGSGLLDLGVRRH